MFTRDSELARACDALISATEQPAVGTLITGLHGLPIRIHCQIRRTRPTTQKVTAPAASRAAVPEVFAYATIIGMSPELLGLSGVCYFAQDFASSDFHGTKAVVMANSRIEVLRTCRQDPMLRLSDVLPVKELRITGLSASGRSLKCEVSKYCTPTELEICAGVVAAARQLADKTQRGMPASELAEVQRQLDDTIRGFYTYFEDEYAAEHSAQAENGTAAEATTAAEAEDEDEDGDEFDEEAGDTEAGTTDSASTDSFNAAVVNAGH